MVIDLQIVCLYRSPDHHLRTPRSIPMSPVRLFWVQRSWRRHKTSSSKWPLDHIIYEICVLRWRTNDTSVQPQSVPFFLGPSDIRQSPWAKLIKNHFLVFVHRPSYPFKPFFTWLESLEKPHIKVLWDSIRHSHSQAGVFDVASKGMWVFSLPRAQSLWGWPRCCLTPPNTISCSSHKAWMLALSTT